MKNTIATRTTGDPKSAARKPKSRAEALGQVFTPPNLAQAILKGLGVIHAPVGAKLLDPCVGPATFPAALKEIGVTQISVDSYDVDPSMVDFTKSWATSNEYALRIELADYLDTVPSCQYDFAVLNPPYLRQEWIERKGHYHANFRDRYDVNVPGAANLYIYFIVKTLLELKVGGRMACIVYDSWQSTLFGKWLQDFLSSRCKSIVVESVPDLPFSGKLIDATIIYCTKGASNENSHLLRVVDEFTASLLGMETIDNLFMTKRGLRLKQADFFMSEIQSIENDGASPFVKKINMIPGYEVPKNHSEAALLLSNDNFDERTANELNKRLGKALIEPENNVSILTWWRERPIAWNQHNITPKAPILFNYYLRRRPRHIHNPDRIYADNFYGLTPKRVDIPVLAWLAALNSTLSVIGMLERARNQGAGLAKLQLFEYRNARIVNLHNWTHNNIKKMSEFGQELISGSDPKITIASIDEFIAVTLANETISAKSLEIILTDIDNRARKPKH